MNDIPVYTKRELYYLSPEFDELRQACFKRDNHQCVVCGSTDRIVPHHLTYRNLYHENLRDLITLCSRCHSIFHNIDNRRKFVDEYYKNEDAENRQNFMEEIENRKNEFEKEEARKKELAERIAQEIKDEYFAQDYCKDGDLDICSWSVLNPIITEKCKIYDIHESWVNKKKLQDWFIYRRCEFFLRCINKGLSFESLCNKTKFTPSYIRKWYDKPRLEAKLNEEQFILSKEDQT